MLILGNDDIRQVLTMKMALEALEGIYRDLAKGEADQRRRMDFFIPTERTDGYYRWSTTEGASKRLGVLAMRIKSDILFWPGKTEEKYCIKPGTYCGLVILVSAQTAEPLALMQDGILQHMRTGAAAGLGVKSLARNDATNVGILGSGGMARSYLQAFSEVRRISRVKVYSPTPENRDRFAAEMSQTLRIPCEAVPRPEMACRGTDIVASATDSTRPTFGASWLEPGMHLTDVKTEEIDAETLERCDVKLRLGGGGGGHGMADMGTVGQFAEAIIGNAEEKARIPVIPPRKAASIPPLVDFLTGRVKGRTDPSQITFFSNGGAQGLQFVAVGARAYELAKTKGLGREIPSDWLLQNIRD